MLAALNGHKDIALALIQAKANLDLQDKNGNTALMRAVGRDIDTAKSLLDAGANPNKQDNSGNTAYDFAKDRYGKSSDIAKLIKKYM